MDWTLTSALAGPSAIAASAGLVALFKGRPKSAFALAIGGPLAVVGLPAFVAAIGWAIGGNQAAGWGLAAILLVWPIGLLYFAIAFVSLGARPDEGR